MLKKLIFALSLVYTLNAFGEGHLVNYWMPDDQQFAVEAGLSYDTLGYTDSGTDIKMNEQVIDGKIYYGILDNLSVSFTLPYKIFNVTEPSSLSYSGLSDWQIGVQGMGAFEMYRLYYGLNYNYSLENSKYNEDGEKTNQFSGGSYLAPYFVFAMDLEPHMFGAYVNLSLAHTQKKEYANSDTIVSRDKGQATTMGLFYEHHLSKDIKFGGEYVTTAGVKTDDNPEYSNDNLSFYGEFALAEKSVIISQLDYGLSNKSDGEKLDSYSLIALALSWRMTF